MARRSPKRAKDKRTTVPRLNGEWRVRLATCESAIRLHDEEEFKFSPNGFVDTVANSTETKVRESGIASVLEELEREGCPKRELLYLLGMCENRGVGKSFAMTGFDPKELRTELRRIRQAAKTIEKINGAGAARDWGTEFGKVLDFAGYKKGKPSVNAEFLRLPALLKEYVSLVEHAAKYLGGKSDFYLNIAKATLVRFVRQHTGEYHHAEVATLLSVMVGEEYAEPNHRVWFGSYQERLQHYRPDQKDSHALRAKKTLLECEAALFYRRDILHPGDKFIKESRRTVLRTSDVG